MPFFPTLQYRWKGQRDWSRGFEGDKVHSNLTLSRRQLSKKSRRSVWEFRPASPCLTSTSLIGKSGDTFKMLKAAQSPGAAGIHYVLMRVSQFSGGGVVSHTWPKAYIRIAMMCDTYLRVRRHNDTLASRLKGMWPPDFHLKTSLAI